MARARARACVVAVVFASVLAAPATAQEWPGLRGPNHDGSAARGSTFGAEAGAMTVRWRAKLGSGYSGVAVSAGRAVTLFSDGTHDVLAAFDAATGREAWRVAVAGTHKGLDGAFNGPISTPVIAAGRVFALGPYGHLLAVDLAKGRVLWRVDLPERMGAKRPLYGFASSPVVAGGVLVVQVGAGKGGGIAGFDPATGERRWTVGDDGVRYQSPALLRLDDREIVVAVGDTQLTGVDPATGRLIFEHPHGGALGEISVNSAVPPARGRRARFRQDASRQVDDVPAGQAADGRVAVQTLWTAPVLRTTYAVPVYHDGHLYGMNGRTAVACVDAATGEIRWRSRDPGDGFPTLVGDQIVFVTKDRTLHVGSASPRGWSERVRVELFEDLVWTAASVAGDAVFARSLGELARVDWTVSAAAVGPAARPSVASPTLARFLQELDRATDKAAAVDLFLAGVGAGPLVDPPDRVVFLYRGDVKDVGIATDLIGIRREDPMQRVPGTDFFFYEARVDPAARVNYQFVRDFGRPMPDPRNPRRVPALGAPGFGPTDEASSLAMPGWREPAYLAEAPEGRRGRMERIEFASSLRQGARSTLQVYVPFSYDTTSHRYATVYVLEGDAAREQGLVPRSLDNLVPERVAPALVVFLGPIDWGTWKPRPPEAMAAVVEVLVKEIVPLIDARFRTVAAPSARGVVGHAFGGIVAIRAAFDDAGAFGALGLQSLVMLDTDENDVNPRVRTADERPLRVYHDWGLYGHGSTREAADMRATNRRFNDYLRAKGYRPAGGEAKDGMGWASWRNRTDLLFAALLPPR